MQLTPTFKIKTPPASEYLSVSDLESQTRNDLVDDGGMAAMFLKAAREMVESASGVSLMPTVWQCFLDQFPDYECFNNREIKLMRGPTTAIGSLLYIDASGDTQTLSTSLYQTDTKRTPARVIPAFGQAWPVVRSNTLNTVTVEFTAGFTSTALIPSKATQAILMLAGYWIENPTMSGRLGTDIAMAYQSLVDALHWEVFDE